MYSAKIKSIKKIGITQTYDLHTPKYHNFLLNNNILSHNSGKTSTCFRLGELISISLLGENIVKSENIIDSMLDLTRFVMEADPNKLSIAIIEEVSVLFPSRRAMSGENVDLARLLDTCRKKQVILLANAPIWPSIDSHMRAMGNVYVETKKIYKMASIVYSKMFRLQTNPRTGKTYTHSFKKEGRDIKKMYTRMPNSEEWKKYERKKDKFMETLYNKLRIRAEKREAKDLKEYGGTKKEVDEFTDQERTVASYYYKDNLKKDDIAKKIGLSQRRIYQILQKIEKKWGFTKENRQIEGKNEMSEPIR